MALNRCREPLKKLHAEGKAITVNGWDIVGFRDDDGNYYERCKQRDGETRWYRLDDDDGDDI